MKEGSGSDSSPEPPAEEYRKWVTWQGQALDMLHWWQELAESPELAQRIQALFELPQRMSELHDMGELLPGFPSAPMSLPEGFPPATQSPVPLPGHQ